MTNGSTSTSTPDAGRATGWRPRSAGAALAIALAAALAATALPAQPDAAEREAAAAVDEAVAAAEAARDRSGLVAARERLQALSRRLPPAKHPRSAIRSRALVEAAALGRRVGDTKEAAGELLRVIEREAEGEWTPRAHFELGELLLARGDWQEAANHLRLAREEWQRRAAAGAAATTDLSDAAIERMTLIHRLILRPRNGQEPWRRSWPFLPEAARIDKPRGVAAGPNGAVVITEAHRAAVIDAGGTLISTYEIRGIVRPSASSRGGGAAITASGATRLQDLAAISFARPQGGVLDRIAAGTQDEFGNWRLLSRRSAEVLHHDAEGRLLETLRSTSLAAPIDIAVGEDGALHVLDAGSRSRAPSVLRFSASGEPEAAFHADWKRPVALDVDPLGNRYVLDAGALQVLVYDREATPVATIGPGQPIAQELRTPEDVAVDAQGRVFIADSRLGAVLVVD